MLVQDVWKVLTLTNFCLDLIRRVSMFIVTLSCVCLLGQQINACVNKMLTLFTFTNTVHPIVGSFQGLISLLLC